MHIEIIKDHKSIKKNTAFYLPNFLVLTGKNGSGKTQLLEALVNSQISKISDHIGVITHENIRYIPFNGLVPNVTEFCDSNAVNQNFKSLWSVFSNAKNNLELNIKNNVKQNKYYTVDDFLNSSSIPDKNQKEVVKRILEKIDTPVRDVTESQFKKHFDLRNQLSTDVFNSNLALIFKSYYNKYDENQYELFLKTSSRPYNYEPYTDDEFREIFGPKPWELINDIFELAKISYRINAPEGHRDLDYRARLKNITTGTEISFNDLSNGEKVLVSMALSIYNVTENKIKTQLLLMDEPDAPLHPEYSKIFLEVIKKYIVEKAGVKVIITSHSPTTIAACTDIPVYEMCKINRIPFPKTKNEAIEILLDGLNSIRVTSENRRQVFVESIYDVDYYENLFNILNKEQPFEIYSHFLAPKSKKEEGSNCEDVKKIVNTLTSFGNDLVYGIVDYDNKNKNENKILIIGDGKRYSIENYILDPLVLGFLLLRENIVFPLDMGLEEKSTFTKLDKYQHDYQKIIDFVLKKINLHSSNKVNSLYYGNFSLELSTEFVNHQGHKLEELVLEAWPQLNQIKAINRNLGDKALKLHIIERVLTEYPEIISQDIVETFLCIK